MADDVLINVDFQLTLVVTESTKRSPFPNRDNTGTGNRVNCKIYVILAHRTAACASLIFSTGRPATCFANARAAGPGLHALPSFILFMPLSMFLVPVFSGFGNGYIRFETLPFGLSTIHIM